MSDDTNEFDYIMKSPEGLLNVRIEASTIREVLLELHTKIEDLNKKFIDFLKSREINQLQVQIDQINTRIESLEQQGVETGPTQSEENSSLIESFEQKLEQTKFLMNQSFRNLIKKSLDELKSNVDQSIADAKDSSDVSNTMKYATIQMFAELQQRIDDCSSNSQSSNVKAKRVPTSEKLSSRTSSAKTSGQSVLSNLSNNTDAISPPDSASQNARITKMNTKLSVLESTFNAINGIIDDMKKKINEVERKANGNSSSISIIEEKIEDIQKSLNTFLSDSKDQGKINTKSENNKYTQPETIIKTVPQQIDIEGIKFDVVQSVLNQVMPFLEEYLEKTDNSQNNQPIQKVDNENKANTFTVSDQKGITESQSEIKSQNDKSSNSNTPSQSKPHRDFSSFMANRITSPRATKPSLTDPRVSACEMQLRALKDSVTALENAMRSQFGLFDSRITELLIRTTSIEKCLEEKGEKIERVEPVIIETRPSMDSTGCQTVDDDVGVMVDLDKLEKDGQISSENQKEGQNQSESSTNKENSPRKDDSRDSSASNQRLDSNDRSTEKSESIQNSEATEKVYHDSQKVHQAQNNSIVKPVIVQRPSTVPPHITSPPITSSAPIKKEDLQLMFGTLPAQGNSSRGAISSRSNLSSRSHVNSQTYEDLDSLTRQLEQQVKELARQIQNTTDRLGEEDRQIHQLRKTVEKHVTKDDLEELKSELEERSSFNKKNNPNSESVTALQLKRVVTSFQNSIKTIDKQLESVSEKVPSFVSKSELTELVEAVTQLALQQGKEKASSTAGGAMGYRCLLCGRPTSQVTGMITESEVARMIGEPPIIGASAGPSRVGADGEAFSGSAGTNELVLMYGKEANSFRATSQMSAKRKKMPILPKITPKTPNLQTVNNNGNNGS